MMVAIPAMPRDPHVGAKIYSPDNIAKGDAVEVGWAGAEWFVSTQRLPPAPVPYRRIRARYRPSPRPMAGRTTKGRWPLGVAAGPVLPSLPLTHTRERSRGAGRRTERAPNSTHRASGRRVRQTRLHQGRDLPAVRSPVHRVGRSEVERSGLGARSVELEAEVEDSGALDDCVGVFE